jgi:regulator of replication initiation timing
MISEEDLEKIINSSPLKQTGTKIIAFTGNERDIISDNFAVCLADIECKKKNILSKKRINYTGDVLFIDLNFDSPKQYFFNECLIPPILPEEAAKKMTVQHLLDSNKKLENVIVQSSMPNLKFVFGSPKAHQERFAGEKIDDELLRIGKDKFSYIILNTSPIVFSHLIYPDEKYMLLEINDYAMEQSKNYITNSLLDNIRRVLEHGSFDSKISEDDKHELFDTFKKLTEKDCFSILNIYEGIKKCREKQIEDAMKEYEGFSDKSPINLEDDAVVKAIDGVIKGSEFNIVPIKTNKKSERFMHKIAREQSLPGDVLISFPGIIDYGEKERFYEETIALNDSINSGKPLVLHQYDKKSLLCKAAQKSIFVKSIEEICMSIEFEGERPKGFIPSMRAKEIAEKYKIERKPINMRKIAKGAACLFLGGALIYSVTKYSTSKSYRDDTNKGFSLVYNAGNNVLQGFKEINRLKKENGALKTQYEEKIGSLKSEVSLYSSKITNKDDEIESLRKENENLRKMMKKPEQKTVMLSDYNPKILYDMIYTTGTGSNELMVRTRAAAKKEIVKNADNKDMYDARKDFEDVLKKVLKERWTPNLSDKYKKNLLDVEINVPGKGNTLRVKYKDGGEKSIWLDEGKINAIVHYFSTP